MPAYFNYEIESHLARNTRKQHVPASNVSACLNWYTMHGTRDGTTAYSLSVRNSLIALTVSS